MNIQLRDTITLKNLNTEDFDNFLSYELVVNNDTINKSFTTNTVLDRQYYIKINDSYIVQPIGTAYDNTLDYYKKENGNYILLKKNEVLTKDDGLKIEFSPSVLQISAQDHTKDNTSLLLKDKYYFGILADKQANELKINPPSYSGETNYDKVLEEGRYINHIKSSYVYITYDNLNYPIYNIDLAALFNDSAKNNGIYLGIEHLVDNDYYNTLSTSEQNDFRIKLNYIYQVLGEPLRENTILLNINLYINNISEQSNNSIKYGPYIINTQWGSNDIAAKLNINKYDITAAVDNEVMRFSSDGLDLITTGYNTGIRIFKGNYDTPVFYANEQGNLYLEGSIYATDSYFSGTIHAGHGDFEGTINATSGTIGSLGIDGNGIYIGEDKNITITASGIIGKVNSEEYFSINTDGSIYAKKLKLGNSAEIEDYLKIGDNCYIYNPKKHSNYFVSVKDNSENNIFSLLSTGEGYIGNMYFNGNTSVIKSNYTLTNTAGWELSPTTSTFNNIVATGSIKSVIFEAQKTQLSGGAFLFKDGVEFHDLAIMPSDVKYYYTKLYEDNIIKLVVVDEDIEYVGEFPNGNYYKFKRDLNGKRIQGEIIDIQLHILDEITKLDENDIYYIENSSLFFENASNFIKPNRDSIVFELDKRYGDDFVDGNLYYITNETREYGFFAVYSAETNSITCVTSNLPTGIYNMAINLGKVEGQEVSDWFIGINSTGQTIPGLSKNGITLSQVKYYENDYHIDPKIILGYIPAGILETGSEETYGLYAQSVYLTGTLTTQYTAESGLNYAGINTISAVPFIYGDRIEEYKVIQLTSQTFIEDTYYIYNRVNGKYTLAHSFDENETYYEKQPQDNSPIIIWAGSKSTGADDIKNALFQVTSNGTIYAQRGYFNGTILTEAEIDAKTLRVASIYGKEDGAALNIQDADVGISFSDKDGNIVFNLDNSKIYSSVPMRFEESTIFNLDNAKTSHQIISIKKTSVYDDRGYGIDGTGNLLLTPKKISFFNDYIKDTVLYNEEYPEDLDGDFNIEINNHQLQLTNKDKIIINTNNNNIQMSNRVQILDEMAFGNFESPYVTYKIPQDEGIYGLDVYIY